MIERDTELQITSEPAIAYSTCYRLPFLSLFHADCMEIMKQYPDKYFDLAIVDPPYGISFMGKEWDSFDPKYQEIQMKRESKRRPRTDGRKATGFQGSAYAGLYDLTPQGMVRFQQWYYEIAKEFIIITDCS